MNPLRDPQRMAARERAGARCSYCGMELSSISRGVLEHHQPRSRGGADDDNNVVYCCERCSLYKGEYWHQTDFPHIRLLHPFKDVLADHLSESDECLVISRTDEGRFYIDRLRLNREPLVRRRRARKLLARARQVDEELGAMIDAARLG